MGLKDAMSAATGALDSVNDLRDQRDLASSTDNNLLTKLRQMLQIAHLEDELAGYNFDDVVGRRIRRIDSELEELTKLMTACTVPVSLGQ